MTKNEELEQLRQENPAQREQVALLNARINALEAQLAKDSHNSHLLPSSGRFHLPKQNHWRDRLHPPVDPTLTLHQFLTDQLAVYGIIGNIRERSVLER